MKTISEKLKATQMESSTKTKVALERKLNGVIANLLRRLGKGVIDKSYAPLEVEFTGKITDSLQYNLVFQEKSYYSDADLEPEKQLFFSLSIIPFGTVSTPVNNN